MNNLSQGVHDGAGDLKCRGIEITEDVNAVMLERIYGDDPNPLSVRGDGAVPAGAFNSHLENLWLEAMADCGEIVHKIAA